MCRKGGGGRNVRLIVEGLILGCVDISGGVGSSLSLLV